MTHDELPPEVEPPVLRAALATVFASVMVVRAVRNDDGNVVDFLIEYVNPSATDIGGRSAAELMGHTVLEVFPGLEPAGLLARYIECVESGEPMQIDAAPYRDEVDGRVVWGLFDLRATPMGDRIVIASIDVTARHEQLQVLDTAKRMSRLGIWRWDAVTGELWWSTELYEIYGWDPSLPISIDMLDERTHPDDRSATRHIVASAIGRGEPFLLEQRIVRPGDDERRLLVSGGAVMVEGELLAVVGTVQDVTELRDLETQLRSAKEQLLERALESEREERRAIETARADAERRYGELVRKLGRSVLLARITTESTDLLAGMADEPGPALSRVTQMIAGALDSLVVMGVAFEDGDPLVPVAVADASGPRGDVLEALGDRPFPIDETPKYTELAQGGDPIVVSGADLHEMVHPDYQHLLEMFSVESMAVVRMEAGTNLIGTVVVARQTTAPLAEGDLDFLRDLAGRCGLALANWRLQRVRARAGRALAALQSITDATVEQLGVDSLLDELLPKLRNALQVDTVRILLTDDGRHLYGGAQLGFGDRAIDPVPVPVGKGVAGTIALSREPLVFRDLSKVQIVGTVLKERNLSSLAGISLWAGDTLVGVLHVGSERPRTFDAWDLELLARAGQRIGLAIERNRLYEGELAARERLEFIATINKVLGRSLDRREVMREVARAAVPRLGDWCTIHVLPDELSSPAAVRAGIPDVHVAHLDPAKRDIALDLQRRYPYDPSSPVGVPEVIRSGRPQLFPQLPYDELERLAPGDERIRALRELGIHSVMVVPLRARGRTFGAMQFARAESQLSYEQDDLRLAMSVADRVGASLENARLFELQRHIARTLQASLLPPAVPDLPGASVALRYWAAGEAAEVGGDFYDVFTLPDDRVGVVIGDVCGKGPQAAAVTGMVRHTLRSAVKHEADPAAALRWVNHSMIDGDQDLFCTAAYGVVSPGDALHELEMAVAGHPLPVIVDAAGRTRDVGSHGNPLGIFDRIKVATARDALAPGETLVLFTDGITDVPPPHDLDLDALHKMLAEAVVGSDSAEEVADRVFDAVQRIKPLDQRDDDIAILVVRRDVVSAVAHESSADGDPADLVLDLSDSSLVPSDVRRMLAAWLHEQDVPERVVQDLAVVASELVSNAVRASADHRTLLRASSRDGRIVLEVQNNTDEIGEMRPHLPDPDALSGRGLFVARSLTDDLVVEVVDHTVRVRATKSVG